MIGVTADTNIYISALNYGGIPRQFLIAARQRRFRLDISPALLNEAQRILVVKFGWTSEILQTELERLSEMVALVHPTQTIDAVPEDPDDNRVLECAVTAGSRYVITGDTALLRLGCYEGIQILRVADFMRLINP